MNLYRCLDIDEETPVMCVGVHPLRWRPEWGEPTMMWAEADLMDVPEVAALVEAARLVMRKDGHYEECPCPNDYDHKYMPHSATVKVCAKLQAALAPFQESTDGSL